ncbi:hypothetical protein B0H15DRAFT_950087 [Mycena belliarum]|uniref:DUF6741 domain-containing protein n=1 Tax=Mycena belliarum TaxID=1033014 RepID=A0AAD6XTW0_9AGAR|nr:hypothetical protein B0H15DRAFT_950087 [Mycena belliae]
MSRRQSLPYAPPMGYPYGDQGYSSYGDQGYSYGENYPGMYADPLLPQSAEYPQSSYPIYGPQAGLIPQSHRLTGPSYEDLSMRDQYYADDMQLPVARNALTPMVGFGNTSRPRHRRHSTVSYSALPPVIDGGYRAPSSMHIKFKRKGALMAGINLGDAQSTRTRLSGNDAYTLHDLHADWRRRIHLRIRWAGYAPLTYEVPLDVYDGRVSMQALSRRVARACIHYLQMNLVPVMYSRVELHHLEEISYGVWQPMLSTR